MAPQADAAKEGVAAAGGTPREFTTISVSDGIGMNHEGMKFSLVSRELIADSIEAVVHGHAYDGLVAFGGCDKTLPGAMMGLVRCNVPGVFLYGGAALPGRFDGRDVTVLDAYEAVGAVHDGRARRGRCSTRMERACKPTDRRLRRAVHGQHHGDGVRGAGPHRAESPMVPGVYSERRASRAGRASSSWRSCARRPAAARPRHARLARERGRDRGRDRRLDQRGAAHPGHRPRGRHPFTVDDVAEVFARTPLIGDLRPGGRFSPRTCYELGGVSVIIRALIESGHSTARA